MLIYLTIYIPFIASAYFDFRTDVSINRKRRMMMFFVIIFTLFRGLRWNVGTDWDQFYEVYMHSGFGNIFTYSRGNDDRVMDFGYMFINAVFHQVGFSYTIFLLVTSLIIQLCFYHFSLKQSRYPILTMIMLMFVGMPFPVRQSISYAIAIWGLSFLMDKKFIKFVIVSLIATSIHKGSAIILPVLILPFIFERIRIKWYYYVLIYASSYLVASVAGDYITLIILGMSSMSEDASAYAEGYSQVVSTSVREGNETTNSILSGFSYAIFMVFLLYIREKYRKKCEDSIKGFETMFFLYVIAGSIENLVRQSDSTGITEILQRVTTTVDMFPLIFPLICTVFIMRKTKNAFIPYVFFICYAGYKFWKQIPGSVYSDLFIPYQTILF